MKSADMSAQSKARIRATIDAATWKGRPVTELTPEELIEAYTHACEQLESGRRSPLATTCNGSHKALSSFLSPVR